MGDLAFLLETALLAHDRGESPWGLEARALRAVALVECDSPYHSHGARSCSTKNIRRVAWRARSSNVAIVESSQRSASFRGWKRPEPSGSGTCPDFTIWWSRALTSGRA